MSASRIEKLVAGLCAAPAAIGATALVGWIVRDDRLKSVVPGLIAMNPLTALCFIAASASFALQRREAPNANRRRAGASLAVLVTLIGGLKLGSYLFGYTFPLDRWLFAGALGDNRMAPNTALCFLLIGAELAMFDRVTRRGYWLAQIPALMVATIALVSLVGYSYGARSLYQMASYVPIALNTATAFGLLSIGTLAARPNRGIGSVLLDAGPGGVMCRWLLPFVVAVPIALGWLRIVGQRFGYYDTEFGAAFMIAVTVMLFIVAVAWIAAALNRADTELRRTLVDLKRTNDEVLDLYNHAPCGYHSIDKHGNFVAMNDTELTWLGYRRDELVGKMHLTDVVTPAGRAIFEERFPKFLKEGHVRDLEYEFVRRDGTTFPGIVNSVAIWDADGNYLASRSTVFDATEKKKAEDAIRRFNEELEQRVRERTEELEVVNADLRQTNEENEMFVYSVSHDLRSPLVNLQGFGQELCLALPELRKLIVDRQLKPEEQRRGLQLIDVDMQQSIRFIQSAVTRLSAIIDALLRLSRAGRVEYQLQKVETNRVVTRIVESMSSTIFDRGVEVVTLPVPDCFGDPTAVEQIFANLVGNALNYLDPQRPGRVEIGCRGEAATSRSDQPCVTFYVQDNGLGIDSAYHGKVFQALKRLHPEVANGEGIGLAIVKRIVERHGGTIWFESTPGIGTTFYFSLPVGVFPEPEPIPASFNKGVVEHAQ